MKTGPERGPNVFMPAQRPNHIGSPSGVSAIMMSPASTASARWATFARLAPVRLAIGARPSLRRAFALAQPATYEMRAVVEDGRPERVQALRRFQ
jgi:hypothetical protein